ncbi:hypothetical protein [Chamaesiphon sp. GL140_3_metabinner_50]|uniref:hypothetical protein n=1 Tax=Chamaesiphon sp. GL140_3_metabinner_50 TaxID=2970812 RepID=UPI0025CC7B9A|nr:hypothetical protein [Chamaesiphon sp. GL140_3_metabinner_50]
MSERLDRLEKIVESNSKAIEALTNQSAEFQDRMTTTIELLTQVVVRLDARQQDQENRINRLEQQ